MPADRRTRSSGAAGSSGAQCCRLRVVVVRPRDSTYNHHRYISHALLSHHLIPPHAGPDGPARSMTAVPELIRPNLPAASADSGLPAVDVAKEMAALQVRRVGQSRVVVSQSSSVFGAASQCLRVCTALDLMQFRMAVVDHGPPAHLYARTARATLELPLPLLVGVAAPSLHY
jgi:hypothetical protein